MAIAHGAGGAASAGTTQVTPACPATVNPDDLIYAVVVNKYPAASPDTPSGWTLASGAQQSGGSGSPGADVGNVFATIFTKIADGTEDGATVTVDIPGGNSAIGRIFRATKAAGVAWDIAFANGNDTSAGTSWSVTTGSIDVKAGDFIVVYTALNTDLYTFSGQACSMAGITFANDTERADAGSGQGDDTGYVLSTHEVTAGSANAALTFTMTASGTATNNPCGATIVMRLREIVSGSGTAALAGVGASGSGEEIFTGSGTVALGGIVASGSGHSYFGGSGTAALAGIGANGVGEEVFSGSGTAALAGVGASGSGVEQFIASGTSALGGLGAAGTGEEQFIGSGTVVLGGVAASGTGNSGLIGSGTAMLAGMLIQGTGLVTVEDPGSGETFIPGPKSLPGPSNRPRRERSVHFDLPRDLMQDQVHVIARDGVVRDGNFRTTKERVVARFVPCLIVASGRSRLPADLIALTGQGNAQVLIDVQPRLEEGFILEHVGTGIRYTVRRPQSYPSEHAAAYQVASIDRDVLGEVRAT